MTRHHSQKVEFPAKRPQKRLVMILGGIVMLAVCVVIRHYWGAQPASAEPQTSTVRPAAFHSRTGNRPSQPRATRARTTRTVPNRPTPRSVRAKPAPPEIVAEVNGYPITREEFGRECLRHYGKDVLESLVNKQLIAEECARQGINVTGADVDAEIERMAARFRLPIEQWLKMLKSERGINPSQYAKDIIWPTLALRRLAGERLKVTDKELQEQFEKRYGPSVRARLIACKSLEKAKQLHAVVVANPDEFGNVAKDQSEDIPSASSNGRIQPIRRHGYYKEIELAAFTMSDGEVSEVIQAGGQYVILKREKLLPPAKVKFEQVAPQLEEIIRDGKTREVAGEIFQQLQNEAKVENVFNDPVRSRALPHVAALINGKPIAIAQLAEECIERHGAEVLEGTINRKLIESACRKRNITVSEKDIDAEIARAASVSVPRRPDGSPDVNAWLELVTKQQGVSISVYRHDSVWPSVALKKLVGESVEITPEDMKKSFEGSYGPRVRCRAIVMQNQRRALQVWEMARKNLTVEHFGDLAEEYSCEPGSQALRGKVPPIKMHGGRPKLEEKAFAMKPGELSGVIQVGNMYIILLCEGYTEPVDVKFEDVRDLLYRDIHEKKLRLAMARHFQQLQQNATIENFLAGTTRRPKRKTDPKPISEIPVFHRVPTPR